MVQDETSLEVIKKLDKQMNKLTMLIGDLLNLAKIQSGRFEFRKELFEVDDLIRETVESLQGSIGKHRILMDGQTEKKIFADRDRIGQVLINLLTNAAKYSPDADKIIVHSEQNEDFVTIAVKDFGIGIPEEAKEKIFDRFFRVEGADENTYPGFGIGLYVSAEIVKRHGGKIWVESPAGQQGSTFYFSLPINTKE
jgi:signal transduction histidine kinase